MTHIFGTKCYALLHLEPNMNNHKILMGQHLNRRFFKWSFKGTNGGQNLRQGIVMKTKFETRVSRMGLGSFWDINIFVMKYYFI